MLTPPSPLWGSCPRGLVSCPLDPGDSGAFQLCCAAHSPSASFLLASPCTRLPSLEMVTVGSASVGGGSKPTTGPSVQGCAREPRGCAGRPALPGPTARAGGTRLCPCEWRYLQTAGLSHRGQWCVSDWEAAQRAGDGEWERAGDVGDADGAGAHPGGACRPGAATGEHASSPQVTSCSFPTRVPFAPTLPLNSLFTVGAVKTRDLGLHQSGIQSSVAFWVERASPSASVSLSVRLL